MNKWVPGIGELDWKGVSVEWQLCLYVPQGIEMDMEWTGPVRG